MNIIETAGDILLLSAVIPIVIFIYRYARYSNWRATTEGRTIMYQKIAFALYFLFLDSLIIFTDYAYKNELRILVYITLISFFWRMTYNLIKAQGLVKKECANKEQEKELK